MFLIFQSGIFAWITVNFLTGETHAHTPHTLRLIWTRNMITCYWIIYCGSECFYPPPPSGGLQHTDSMEGIIDLGGGSMQITFSPRDEVRLSDINTRQRERE